MEYVYNVIFQKEPEGGFTAIVPSLPGCVSFGKTLEKSRRLVEDAIAAYLTSLKKHGEAIPTDESAYMTAVRMRPQKHGWYA